MAQFVPFDPKVEVNGETVMTTVIAFPDFMRVLAIKMLESKGITKLKPGGWYSQKAWLNSFKEINEKYGSHTLFEIGKGIPSNAKFPPEVDSLERGLDSINVAYHMNHRNGEIGYYKVMGHDRAKRIIIMQCKNPYPCDFDRGIITAVGRKFEPNVEVKLDESKPSRKSGAEDSWYIITY